MLVPQANATKTVNLEGEEDLQVWEFKIDLRVVALKGSVPNQWVEDFKQVRHMSWNACRATSKHPEAADNAWISQTCAVKP